MAINNDMRMQMATVTQHDVFANNTVRPDLAISANLGPRMNDSGGMKLSFRFYCFRF